MKLIKSDTAGFMIIKGKDTFYIPESGKFGWNCNDGCIYKDEKAFLAGKGICYIPEYGFTEDAKDYFTETELELIYKNTGVYESKVSASGYSRQDLISLCNGDNDLALELFYHLDWQYPETLCEEWDMDSYYYEEPETELLETAKALIIAYFEKEFEGQINFNESNTAEDIGIAYSETEDGKDIEVIINLNNLTLTQKMDNEIRKEKKFNTLKEFIEDELRYLDFNMLVSIDEE